MKKEEIKIRLNTKIYPLEAIYGACYVFIDRAYVFLASPKAGIVDIYFKPKNVKTGGQREKLAGEFNNELLNYAHRMSIAGANRKTREYIVERALYAAIEGDNRSAGKDELDDPLGIAIPWEEKYGNKKS
jgi:His-Xaa-Ser system protein HxsD